jgi:hypothetical protein
MIARVSIKGIWSAVGEDEQASKDLAQQKGIRSDVYRAIKKICDPKQVPSLKEFNSARSTLYAMHRTMTLAWDDKAGRMLPATMYFEYMQKIGEQKQRVIDNYEKFLNDIPGLKAKFQSDPETAGAYRAEDWPDVNELRDKVDIRVKISPVTDASDFRVQLGEGEVAKIKQQIQKDAWNQVAGGVGELIRELKECVLDSAQRLDKYGRKEATRFSDTAVTNVRNLVGTARKLNVLGDASINQILDEIEKGICSQDPQVLRDNCVVRDQTISSSNLIARKLASIESVLFEQAAA